jgi:DNA-binding transcriptional regulator YiaG
MSSYLTCGLAASILSDMDAIEFAAALRKIGVRQREFAKNNGIREETVSRWARARRPIPKRIANLVNALVEISELQNGRSN